MFDVFMKPKREENVDMNMLGGKQKEILVNALNYGLDPWTAIERLDEWFKKLNLPLRKGIVPLGHNYCAFDQLFMIDWLGKANYESMFRSDVRDLCCWPWRSTIWRTGILSEYPSLAWV